MTPWLIIIAWPVSWFLISAIMPDDFFDPPTVLGVILMGPIFPVALLAFFLVVGIFSIPFTLGQHVRHRVLRRKLYR